MKKNREKFVYRILGFVPLQRESFERVHTPENEAFTKKRLMFNHLKN